MGSQNDENYQIRLPLGRNQWKVIYIVHSSQVKDKNSNNYRDTATDLFPQ